MTIDEAKYELDYCIRDMIEQKTHNDDKAIDIAVKSLEAWEKVRQEIISERNHRRDRGHHEQSTGLSKAIEIINKHLQEVE